METKTIVTQIPFMENLVKDLKEKTPETLVERNLSPEDLGNLMDDVIKDKITNTPDLKINSGLKVEIDNLKARVHGNFSFSHPLAGTSSVELDMSLGNRPDNVPLIKALVWPKVTPNLSQTAIAYLTAKGTNVQDEVKKVAADPNRAIFNLIDSQLKLQGRTLTWLEAQFTIENKLHIGLKSRPIK